MCVVQREWRCGWKHCVDCADQVIGCGLCSAVAVCAVAVAVVSIYRAASQALGPLDYCLLLQLLQQPQRSTDWVNVSME